MALYLDAKYQHAVVIERERHRTVVIPVQQKSLALLEMEHGNTTEAIVQEDALEVVTLSRAQLSQYVADHNLDASDFNIIFKD